MNLPYGRPWLLSAAVCAAGLVGLYAMLQRDAPLFVNLGAGDEDFARGFRSGWERDGRGAAGHTTFHWTEDGARLEIPVIVTGGRLSARIRLARFTDAPAEITLLAAGRTVAQWPQPPRGWQVREFPLGDVRGPLQLQFRSRSVDGEALGLAIDWVEIDGVDGLLPRPELVPGLVVLLIATPLLLGALAARRWMPLAVALPFAAAWLAVSLDRLGGLVALSNAGTAALPALAVLGLGAWVLRRAWPDVWDRRERPGPLLLPAAAALAFLLAFSHPFYYYPDVDTHVRLLHALQQNPWLLPDPTQPWARRGDWTREIGGQPVAIPYSVVFHALAWPFARILGEPLALKAVAAGALGLTLLLVAVLVRSCGGGRRAALLAQAFAVTAPVATSRFGLALYPTLLAQALNLGVVIALVRGLGAPGRRRTGVAWLGLLLLAEAAYTGSILVLLILTTSVAAVEAGFGDRRAALRLLLIQAVAAALVLATMYAGFLAVLWHDVLPHLAGAPAAAASRPGLFETLVQVAQRLGIFFGVALPLLALAGLGVVHGAARRVLAGALLAAGIMLLGRPWLPALFRDAKDVELLAPVLATLGGLGVVALAREGRARRFLALGLAGAALLWGVVESVAVYRGFFVAVGR